MEDSIKTELLRIAIKLYETGPSQSRIWSRSGGDISLIFINQVGRNAWYEAIELLANGGGGQDITPNRLVQEMLKDFPNNQSLLVLQHKLPADKKQGKKQNITDEIELDYIAEEQPWFVADFIPTVIIPTDKLQTLVSDVEVTIFTATEVELKYTLNHFEPLNSRTDVLKGVWGSETYYIGKFGAFNAVLTKCEMGLSAVNAATLATEEGLRLWKPKAAFMVGIAFAKNPEKQHIGQVLIAKSVIPYDNQRVGEIQAYRGIHLPSDTTLLNRFENAYDWKFILPDGSVCKKDSGPILSAEKLVDNLNFRDELFKQFPTAVGGEMEGAGFYAAALRKKIPCILLKSICDWADGQKHKKHQSLAAATASSLLFHVLSQRHISGSDEPSNDQVKEPASPVNESENDNELKKILINYSKHLLNRNNLSGDDFEQLSQITFLELVEIEIVEKYSIEKWRELESSFHRAMRRGPTSALNMDESENSVRHLFINVARKNYLQITKSIEGWNWKFEDMWDAVKKCYTDYY